MAQALRTERVWFAKGEDAYCVVREDGRVFTKDGTYLVPYMTKTSGWPVVRVPTRGKRTTVRRVASLVARGFLGRWPADGRGIGFRDGDPMNCKASNLCWVVGGYCPASYAQKRGRSEEENHRRVQHHLKLLAIREQRLEEALQRVRDERDHLLASLGAGPSTLPPDAQEALWSLEPSEAAA